MLRGTQVPVLLGTVTFRQLTMVSSLVHMTKSVILQEVSAELNECALGGGLLVDRIAITQTE